MAVILPIALLVLALACVNAATLLTGTSDLTRATHLRQNVRVALSAEHSTSANHSQLQAVAGAATGQPPFADRSVAVTSAMSSRLSADKCCKAPRYPRGASEHA